MVLDVREAQASSPWEELDEWNASPKFGDRKCGKSN